MSRIIQIHPSRAEALMTGAVLAECGEGILRLTYEDGTQEQAPAPAGTVKEIEDALTRGGSVNFFALVSAVQDQRENT